MTTRAGWRSHRATIGMAVVAAIAFPSAALTAATADADNGDVQWRAALASQAPLAPGALLVLHLQADIPAGWHVYALHEPPGGPTALTITVDQSAATPAGEISGPAPARKHDRSFNLETQTYSGAIELSVPLKLSGELAAGEHVLPVKVRFQSCSDRECRPPRTVALDVNLNVVSGA